MDNIVPYIAVGILTLGGAAIFFHGFNRMHRWRMIKDIPRSKIRSVAIGMCEIHGTIRAGELIKTPFSDTDCVYYHYRIEEYRRHTSRDSKGRTKHHYSWDTIARGDRSIPFFGKDETGEILVNPDKAEFNVDIKKMFYQRAGVFGGISSLISSLEALTSGEISLMDRSELNLEPIKSGKKSFFSLNRGRVGDRKYYESYLEDMEKLFVIGTAANEAGVPNDICIKKGEAQPTFIISNKSEENVLKSLRNRMIVSFIVGALMLVGGITLFLKLQNYI